MPCLGKKTNDPHMHGSTYVCPTEEPDPEFGGHSMPFSGWDGHLPSDPIERKILDAIDGFEDDDGNKLGTDFLNPEGHLDSSGAEVRVATLACAACAACAR